MTCIVAVKNKGRIVMGGDSAGVSHLDITVRKDPKVFRNGEFIIGYTSSFRMGQLLHFKFKPPKIPEGKDLYRYMVRNFIEGVRECFTDGGFTEIQDSKESGGHFLVGIRDRLFEIGSDFQVGESVEDYASCGCGESYALGCLASLPVTLPGKTKVRRALEVAEKFSGGVRSPFTILST